VARFIRGGLISVVGLLSSLTAWAEAPVWAIEGARNTVYLAGSVHLLRAQDAALPAAFERAYADADVLVMELDLDDMDPMAMSGWVLENGTLNDGRTLRDVLGTARFERLEREGNRLGVPLEMLERMEPWLAAMTLAQIQYVKLGFDPEHGVEKQLERRARMDRKTITGLESMEDQLGILDGLSPEEQAHFLDLTLEEMHDMESETNTLLAAWRNGDAKQLASILSDEYDVAPTLYRRLVSERNRRWMPQIEQLLRDDKDYLIVVGALHLVGEDGLLELAGAKGYRAKQLP
jgi:uncharacterized protein YbaP (TraB family)